MQLCHLLYALQVRQQADQLEQMELSQQDSDRAVKVEVERTRLAAQQSKEREAAAKKATSALMAAQQRQDHEVEQLTRRFQVCSPCRKAK